MALLQPLALDAMCVPVVLAVLTSLRLAIIRSNDWVWHRRSRVFLFNRASGLTTFSQTHSHFLTLHIILFILWSGILAPLLADTTISSGHLAFVYRLWLHYSIPHM